MRREGGTILGGLQVLRAVAALAVVLYHLLPFEAKYLPGASVVPVAFEAGRAGVDVFFVLSGFLAVWTTRGPNASAGSFLLRRVTRIYPVYWVYCGLLLALGALAPGLLANGGKADITASLLLIPSPAPPLLLVAWTLVFEMYFYLVFALLIALRTGRSGRFWLLLSWGAAVIVLHETLAPDRSQAGLSALLSPLVLEFLAGCAAAAITLRAGANTMSQPLAALAGLLGLAGLVTCLAFNEALYAAPWARVSAYGAASGLLLIGCTGGNVWLARVLPCVLVRMGDASFSLYLSHLFVLAGVGLVLSKAARFAPVLATSAGHVAAMVFAVLAAILVAEASYRWIELTVLRLTRRLLERPPLRTAVAAS